VSARYRIQSRQRGDKDAAWKDTRLWALHRHYVQLESAIHDVGCWGLSSSEYRIVQLSGYLPSLVVWPKEPAPALNETGVPGERLVPAPEPETIGVSTAAERIADVARRISNETWHDESGKKAVLTGLKLAQEAVEGQRGTTSNPYEIETLADYTIDSAYPGAGVSRMKVEKQVHRKSGKTRIQITLPYGGGYLLMSDFGWKLWRHSGGKQAEGKWTA
jgi:hypothetical protein